MEAGGFNASQGRPKKPQAYENLFVGTPSVQKCSEVCRIAHARRRTARQSEVAENSAMVGRGHGALVVHDHW